MRLLVLETSGVNKETSTVILNISENSDPRRREENPPAPKRINSTDLSLEIFVSVLSLGSGATTGAISSVAISESTSKKLSVCSCTSLELLRLIIIPEIKQVTANREKIRTAKTPLIYAAIWDYIS